MNASQLTKVVSEFERWWTEQAPAVLANLGEHSKELDKVDDEICQQLRLVETLLRERKLTRVFNVAWGDDGSQLAWSGAKGRWRLVLRDGVDDAVTEVLSLSRSERADVVCSGALRRLIERIRREDNEH